MLKVTGTLGGKTYKDEVVSASEIADYFNLPRPSKEEMLVLESTKYHLDQFGQAVVPRSIVIPAEVTGFDPKTQSSISIRYYESMSIGANNTPIYSPREVSFSGKASAYDHTKYEQFLILFLSPLCESSPFKGNDPFFRFKNLEAEAKQANEMASLMMRVMDEVTASTDDRIERFAVAFGYQGSTPAQTRVNLIRKVTENPTRFVQQWMSDSGSAKGLVLLATNRGVLTQGEINGQLHWIFKDGTPALKVPNGMDPVLAAVNHFTSNFTAYADLESMMINAENGVTHIDSTREIVEKAIVNGVLYIDRRSNNVYLIPKGSDFESGKMLMSVSTSDHVTEIVNHYKQNDDLLADIK